MCRIPSVLDKQYARSRGIHPHVIASLRGMYEETTGQTLESTQDYDEKLIPFKKGLQEKEQEKLNKVLNASPNAVYGNVINLLSYDFSRSEINDLVGYLYDSFADFIDYRLGNPSPTLKALMDSNKHYTRQEAIRAIGIDDIIKGLFNKIRKDAVKKDIYSEETRELLDRVIKGNYLEALMWLAKDEIARREGVKFGKKIRFAVEFTNEENLDAQLKLEESVKEGWQFEVEKESPFRNVGQKVRAYLGRQLKYKPQLEYRIKEEKSKIGGAPIKVRRAYEIPERSAHGFFLRHDPLDLHKQLQDIITGCRDSEHMMQLIKRAGKNDLNILKIYEDLEKDHQLRDAFYKDFKKTKCSFTKVYINKARNLVHTIIRSSSKGRSFSGYIHDIGTSKNLNGTIFRRVEEKGSKVGKFNLTQKNSFASYMNENVLGDSFASTSLQVPLGIEDTQEEKERKAMQKAREVVNTINKYLGFDMTTKEIDSLLANKVKLKSFLADAKAIATDAHIGDKTLVNDASQIFKDRITAMIRNIAEASSNVSRSVRIGESTYFTDIMTCKVANMIDYVKSFAADAREALSIDLQSDRQAALEEVVKNIRNWVIQNWGESSEYFKPKLNGEKKVVGIDYFYNDWINTLYKITTKDLEDTNSFIYHFAYDRAMLYNDIMADDFSEQIDLKMFIANYFSHDDSSNLMENMEEYARYPLFTTGDAVALKFITARRFGYEDLMNQFIRVAKQEIARMQLETRVKQRLEKEGYNTKGIVTSANTVDAEGEVKEVTGKFIYLRALNKYKSEIAAALDNGTINNVLREILEKELFEEYKKDFLEVIDKKELLPLNREGTKYDGFGNISALNPENVARQKEVQDVKDINKKEGLFLYYLNTKLAYTQQFQFLGANPAPFGLSTAMQKRYKAYNAPGIPMDIHARDIDGNRFVTPDAKGNYVEKVLYFEDTHQSVEKTDPEFARSMALNFGCQKLGISVKEALADSDKLEKALKEGREDDRYKQYQNNDATDGQGYRILSSYRAVMGMSNQWNDGPREQHYREIQAMRRIAWDEAKKSLGWRDRSFESLSTDEKRLVMSKAHFTAEQIDELNAKEEVFQPIKPHTSTVEKVTTENGDVLLVPVEHKYAEVLLIPEMFGENTFLKQLAIEMELKGVDVACSEQCVKVGSFGAARLTENSSNKGENWSTPPEEFVSRFDSGYIHSIDYADYTIQVNVPEHISASQLFGTQLRKHVFDAINLMAAYNYGGVEKARLYANENVDFSKEGGGKAFIKFYNALICENMTTDLINLTKELSDSGRLANLLAELKSNDIDTSIDDIMKLRIDEDGNFVSPLCEPSGAYNIESIITSLFKKEVSKQHINGGSCVQVSDYGTGFNLQVHTDKNGNITTVDCAQSWDEDWISPDGRRIKLKFSDYCNADGTLIANPDLEPINEDHLEKFKEKVDIQNKAISTFYDFVDETKKLQDQPVNKSLAKGILKVVTKDQGWVESFVDFSAIETILDVYKAVVSYYNGFMAVMIYDKALKNVNERKRWLAENKDKLPQTKIERDFPGILDRVAYHIPTERMYSVISLKVVRFLPKTMGGIIMVPSQFVTVAGVDFDLNNLFFFKKEFKAIKEDDYDVFVSQVWESIYKIRVESGVDDSSNSSPIYKKLKAAQARRKELVRAINDPSNSMIAKLKEAGVPGIEELANSAMKDNLYDYWEDAGLDRELGMSAEEYFAKHVMDHRNKFPGMKFEQYDYNKTVAQNTVAARNNELIKCIQSRLTDPATFNSRYTPGGFTHAKRDKKVLKAVKIRAKIKDSKGNDITGRIPTLEEYETYVDKAIKGDKNDAAKQKEYDDFLNSLDDDLDATNVLTTVEYNTKNRVAGKVIGVMANHNTNAVYSKIMGLLKLKVPIKSLFGFRAETDAGLNDLNIGVGGRDYMLTLAELLAASVDAVKDPVLGDLMINSYTANVACLLARTGFNTEEIGLLLNQPIIQEVCGVAANRGEKNLTRAMREVAKKHNIELSVDYDGSIINKANLYAALTTTVNTEADKNRSDSYQANILKAYYALSNQAQALSDFIAKTKYTAANSIENTIGSLIALLYDNKAANEQETNINKHLVIQFEHFDDAHLVDEAIERQSPIWSRNYTLKDLTSRNYKEALANTPFAFEQMVHDAVKAFVDELSGHWEYSPDGKKSRYIKGYFPYNTDLYRTIYDSLYANLNYGQMDKDIIDTVNRQLPVYLLNTLTNSQFNADETREDGTTNKMYYIRDFTRQLRDFLYDREYLKTLDREKAAEEYKKLRKKYTFLTNTNFEGIIDNELLDSLTTTEYTIPNEASIFNALSYRESDWIAYSIGIESEGHFNKEVKNRLTSAWMSLVGQKEVEQDGKLKKIVVEDASLSLAHALFMYNFYTRGYEVGRNAFSNITPTEVLETLAVNNNTTYYDFYEAVRAGQKETFSLNRFLVSFYLNNADNYKLVKGIYKRVPSKGDFNIDSLPPGLAHLTNRGGYISFRGDAYDNYEWEDLTLALSKRNLSELGIREKPENLRILVPAFTAYNTDGNRYLFVLVPSNVTTEEDIRDLELNQMALSNPLYNIRYKISPVLYKAFRLHEHSNVINYSDNYGPLVPLHLVVPSGEIRAFQPT